MSRQQKTDDRVSKDLKIKTRREELNLLQTRKLLSGYQYGNSNRPPRQVLDTRNNDLIESACAAANALYFGVKSCTLMYCCGSSLKWLGVGKLRRVLQGGRPPVTFCK